MPASKITQRAERDLASIGAHLIDEVDADIIAVIADPREAGFHLKGAWYCRWSRYTAGNRRILYRIEDGTREKVVILGIPHRKTAYPRSRH